ncbi:putative prolyl endopeptidase [Rickettsia argasii T170-B]|uniref:Putative prolyl endopeptidase n=1 Tax=Rickettsia argasii T170-B TaxID=1268837 RepID=A0A0F3RGA8_9RICK|nr:putative prolyl endopeptidase [Rickettsia argasii T170-B]
MEEFLSMCLRKTQILKLDFLGSVYSGHGSGSDLKGSANYLINIHTFFANALKLKIN